MGALLHQQYLLKEKSIKNVNTICAQISVAHFSCLGFFAKNEKNKAIFREKRKIHEKYFFAVKLWNCTGDKYYIIVASEFQFNNPIRSRLNLVLVKILFHFGKIGSFWGFFWPNLVIFAAFFRKFFRGQFFAKNFSPNHFSFFAKNEKLCNTNFNTSCFH